MSPRTALWLAAPRTAADRRRERLAAAAIAGCAVLLLAAWGIATITRERYVDPRSGLVSERLDPGLAPSLDHAAWRLSNASGLLLLVLPFAVLAWQALRTGTAARERRLAALSLSGASPRQLRRLAAVEGTRAAVLGVLGALPAYLVLWLVLARALPSGRRWQPDLSATTALGVLVVALVSVTAGATAAVLAARPAAAGPLGVTRRAAGRPPVAGAVVAVAALAWAGGGSSLVFGNELDLRIWEPPIAIVLLAVYGAPWIAWGVAAVAARRPGVVTVMAARRLRADVRTAGRAGAVLVLVGIVSASFVRLLTFQDGPLLDPAASLYLVAAGVAAAVTVGSLVIGAGEQVLDGRREAAAVVALGAAPDLVLRAVRRQLVLATVPPLVLGVLAGWWIAAFASIPMFFPGSSLPRLLLAIVLQLAVAVAVALGAARVATSLVRPEVRRACRAENLRTA